MTIGLPIFGIIECSENWLKLAPEVLLVFCRDEKLLIGVAIGHPNSDTNVVGHWVSPK